jgi:hypothetical protein
MRIHQLAPAPSRNPQLTKLLYLPIYMIVGLYRRRSASAQVRQPKMPAAALKFSDSSSFETSIVSL